MLVRLEIPPFVVSKLVTSARLVFRFGVGGWRIGRVPSNRRTRSPEAATWGRWEPEEGVQGVAVLLGSVSSQGNKGQISYATAKALSSMNKFLRDDHNPIWKI